MQSTGAVVGGRRPAPNGRSRSGEREIQYRRHSTPLSSVATVSSTPAALDDGRGPDVVVVAREQKPAGALYVGDLHGLARHLGREAPSTESGQDDVADVTTSAGEEVIETDAYRDVARSSPSTSAASTAPATRSRGRSDPSRRLAGSPSLRPRPRRVVVERERETCSLKLGSGGERGELIIGSERSQHQRHRPTVIRRGSRRERDRRWSGPVPGPTKVAPISSPRCAERRSTAQPGSWTSSINVPKDVLGCTKATIVPREPRRGASSMTRPPAALTDSSALAQSSTR